VGVGARDLVPVKIQTDPPALQKLKLANFSNLALIG